MAGFLEGMQQGAAAASGSSVDPVLGDQAQGGFLEGLKRGATTAAATVDALNGKGAGAMNPNERLKYQQAIGEKKAAMAGGAEGFLDYLDKTDPKSAVEYRSKQQDYQNSIAQGAKIQEETKNQRLQAEKDSALFNANIYAKAEELRQSDPAKFQEFWAKAQPIVKQHDPNVGEEYDPMRAELAIAQGVTVQQKSKQDFEMKMADKNIRAQREAPQSDLAKQQQDVANALGRGDYNAANQLQGQVQNTLFKQSEDRIRASNGDATVLRKEFIEANKDYVVARGAYGQIQAGLGANSSDGDKAALIGYMKLLNPQLALTPGELATKGNAPGVSDDILRSYNAILTGKNQILTPDQRTSLQAQSNEQFKVRDTQNQQMSKQYAGLAERSGLDPRQVVLDYSPSASPYTPNQETQLKTMTDADLMQKMQEAAAKKDPATGAPLYSPAELQQKKAIIDRIRQGHAQLESMNGTQQQIAQAITTLAPKADPTIVQGIAQAASSGVLEKYGINTPERQKMFMAQIAHESAGFKTTEEYASGKAYEGRKDLGNTEPGDGPRFKGRGVIQLTGRANYENYGKKLGLDLLSNPQLAADPKVALEIAAAYWEDHGLNELADQGKFKQITQKINGGQNGAPDRERYLSRANNLNIFALGGK